MFRYRVEQNDWIDVWSFHSDHRDESDARFAVMESQMQDHLNDEHYNYRIIEWRELDNV